MSAADSRLRSSAGARFLKLFLTFVLALYAAAGFSQDTADVHLEPRPSPQPEALSTHTRGFQVNVDLVLVPVYVTDAWNRPVLGLDQGSFTLFDEAREQPIRFFSTEDVPLSVGLILDVSKSMRDKIDLERDALAEFAKYANPQDEYFAVGVSNKPVVLSNFTQSVQDIQTTLATTEPSGYTALMDSIYLTVNKMRHATYSKRVILIISDGGENASRYTVGETKRFVEESDILVYAIRTSDEFPFLRSIEEKLGGNVLAGITQASGGRTVSVYDSEKLPDIAAAISRELRNQYVLGYRPEEPDGKKHRIRVQIKDPRHPEPLQAYYKRGYVAPSR